jgi:hypothetical protein
LICVFSSLFIKGNNGAKNLVIDPYPADLLLHRFEPDCCGWCHLNRYIKSFPARGPIRGQYLCFEPMALDISRIQAICFDVDGTLSDTDDQWTCAVERRLMPFSWMFPKRQIRPFARWSIMCAETPGNLLYHLFDRIDMDDEIGRLYNFLCQRQIGRRPRSFWLVEGIREALELLCPALPHVCGQRARP